VASIESRDGGTLTQINPARNMGFAERLQRLSARRKPKNTRRDPRRRRKNPL